MKCPYCNNDMKQGYIQSNNGLTWAPKRHLIPALSFYDKNGILLTNEGSDNFQTVYAYNCDECKKVVIEYATDGSNGE